MSDNPFRAPESDLTTVTGVLSGNREDLRRVAKYQRGIMLCILMYVGCVVSQFVLPNEIKLLAAIAVLIVGLAGMVFVFLLATKVYGTGLGILLGIATLLPCVNLIVLLCINSKATSILKGNGIKVGLLGANPADV
jgi:hypothetical protein